jgi:hypothetical protein
MFEQFKDKKKYCPYFQYLSIFAVLMLVILLAMLVSSKKFDMKALPALASLFIMYFQNRLLFSMCMD